METQERTIRPLWRNWNFLLLWCAYGVSATGDHLSEMALLKTQDALNQAVVLTQLTARMSFMFFLPFFLLSPFAGALADRVSRRGLMVTADLVRATIMFFFAGLIGWAQGWGSGAAFVPLMLVGAFAAIFSPARSALLPTLIDEHQLVRANATLSGLGIIATMTATKIGGYLADRYVPTVAFRWDAASFIGSAILLLMMRRPMSAPQSRNIRRRPFLAEIAGGINYVRAHRHVAELLAIAGLVWFCGALVYSVIPTIVRDNYHGTYSLISNYRAFLGLGFILGAGAMTLLGDALRSEIAISWGLIGIAASMAMFAGSTVPPLTPAHLATIGAVAIVGAGFFAVSVMASFQSLLQRTVANRMRGRIFGLNDLLSTGSLLVATGMLSLPTWRGLDRWAGGIVAAVAVITFVAGALTIRRRILRSALRPGIIIAEHVNEFIAKSMWRMERVGPATVPRQGAAIVTANHASVPDPFLLCAAVPYRLISFLVAEEYTRNPIVRWFLEFVECIPVRRGTRETSATRKAIEHLEQGKLLGVFIEGGIARPKEPLRLKDGVAHLALKTGAAVIPAYISGTVYRDGVIAGILTRHRARVKFGPAVNLDDLRTADPSRERIRAATRRIYDAVLALAPDESKEKNEARLRTLASHHAPEVVA